MECSWERTDNAAIVTLNGRIDSAGSIQLDRVLKEQLGPAERAVIFDMAGVSYMSSAGIRVFSVTEKTLRQRDGHLYLCGLQPAVAKVLEITGFSRVFSICATRDEALSRGNLAGSPSPGGVVKNYLPAAHVRITADRFTDHEGVLWITGSGDRSCPQVLAPDDLVPRVFAPDCFSAGIGAPGDSPSESLPGSGLLVTMGGAIFWRPSGSFDPPDFLIPRADAPRILLNTAFSIATDEAFHELLTADPVHPGGVCLADLCTDILRYAKDTREERPAVMSMVICAAIPSPEGTVPAPAGGRTLLAFGICIDPASILPDRNRDLLERVLCQRTREEAEKRLFLYLHGLVFDTPPSFSTRDIVRLISGTAAREPCSDILRLTPDSLLGKALVGVKYISRIECTDSMPVRIHGDCPGWNRTFETITRWMHKGCSGVELTPLTGGFSGTLVFRVSATDSRGAAMMPLVMKLGAWPLIEAEIRGYTDHVKRYIQNNATQIIETERIGDLGGILYNFVGIRGAESTIFSLEDFYCAHAPDEIIPVFDSLFRVVLQGWYGDPKKREMALYQEYNRFWNYDQIREYARARFGASPDQNEIELPFGLGRSVNPLWFVETVMPGRLGRTFSVYESPVHCDLNMKNVLMDETRNMWLIDFADTKYSHILRDIIKLEAVLKGEMVPVNSPESLRNLALLDARFLTARSLSDIPDLPDHVDDPSLEKAFRVVRNLRMHADRITPGDDDITQYYLGLLPYTLNLLSYISVNDYQKEYGWIASSLICKRLMEDGS